MKIPEWILNKWEDRKKFILWKIIFTMVFVVFGINLAKTDLNLLGSFEGIALQFSKILNESLRVTAFFLVPCFVYLWLHSGLVIISLKKSFKYHFGLILQNSFYLWLSWSLAYKDLFRDYKLVGIELGSRGWLGIDILCFLYAICLIVFVLVGFKKVSREVFLKIWLSLVGIFSVYFLCKTLWPYLILIINFIIRKFLR